MLTVLLSSTLGVSLRSGQIDLDRSAAETKAGLNIVKQANSRP